MPKCTQLHPNMPNCAQLHPNMPNCAQLHPNMPNCPQLHPNMPNYTQICQTVPKYAQMRPTTPNYAQLHPTTPKYKHLKTPNIRWPPPAKSWLTGKDPDVGQTEGRRRGWQRMRWLDGITDSMDMSLSSSRSWWWTGRPGMLRSMGSQELDTTERLNWTVL